MRSVAFIPLVCAIGAFVLSLLCILAGYKQSFMENFELMTFNTSLLGSGIVDTAAGQALDQIPGGSAIASALATRTIELPPSATSYIPALLVSAIDGNTAESLIENAADSVAEKLGIYDFYKLHILDYCEGYYEPQAVGNDSVTPSQNVTFCSPAQALFFFNVTQILMEQLLPGVSLDQIQFPSQVDDALEAVAVVQKTMFVLYCVGCGFAALAVLLGFLAFLADGRGTSLCNVLLNIIAFIILAIASALATAFIIVVTNAVNEYGTPVFLSAYRGTNFLIITWVATVLPLVGAIFWCFDCCVGPSRRKPTKSY